MHFSAMAETRRAESQGTVSPNSLSPWIHRWGNWSKVQFSDLRRSSLLTTENEVIVAPVQSDSLWPRTSSLHRIPKGKDTRMSHHSFLQRIFFPGRIGLEILYGWRILYHLSHRRVLITEQDHQNLQFTQWWRAFTEPSAWAAAWHGRRKEVEGGAVLGLVGLPRWIEHYLPWRSSQCAAGKCGTWQKVIKSCRTGKNDI